MFMTKTVLKNLATGSATRLYPHKKRDAFKGVRGELKIDMAKCTLCGLCRIRCPSQAIAVSKEEKSWRFDPFSCVYCGICVDLCPKKCLFQEVLYRPPRGEKDLELHLCPVHPEKTEETGADKGG